MTRGIAPGVLCVIVRSEAGNEGAIGEVIRWVPAHQVVPEASNSPNLRINYRWSGWLLKFQRPLKFNPREPRVWAESEFYGVCSQEQLRPITPPPGSVTEDDAYPITAEREAA